MGVLKVKRPTTFVGEYGVSHGKFAADMGTGGENPTTSDGESFVEEHAVGDMDAGEIKCVASWVGKSRTLHQELAADSGANGVDLTGGGVTIVEGQMTCDDGVVEIDLLGVCAGERECFQMAAVCKERVGESAVGNAEWTVDDGVFEVELAGDVGAADG